jgi:hypothetical protein
MSINTPDHKLRDAVIQEMAKRVAAGDRIEVELNVPTALAVMTALQVEIREHRFTGEALFLVQSVADHLARKLGNTPAFAEYCERSWWKPIRKVAKVPGV